MEKRTERGGGGGIPRDVHKEKEQWSKEWTRNNNRISECVMRDRRSVGS